MSRPRNAVRTPRNHKGSAVLDVYQHGQRRQVVLGPWRSKIAEAEYKRFLAEYATGDTHHPAGDLTINELLFAYLKFAEQHYRTPDGNQTTEVKEIRQSLRPVREVYGHSIAKEFGPLALKAVRQRMIESGLCRSVINNRADRIRRMFRWATSEELIPVTAYQSLRTLSGLRKGRTEARESKPIQPVDPAHVAASLPFLNRHQRAMVELQQLTGMRPGEVCKLTIGQCIASINLPRRIDSQFLLPRAGSLPHHGVTHPFRGTRWIPRSVVRRRTKS